MPLKSSHMMMKNGMSVAATMESALDDVSIYIA